MHPTNTSPNETGEETESFTTCKVFYLPHMKRRVIEILKWNKFLL